MLYVHESELEHLLRTYSESKIVSENESVEQIKIQTLRALAGLMVELRDLDLVLYFFLAKCDCGLNSSRVKRVDL